MSERAGDRHERMRAYGPGSAATGGDPSFDEILKVMSDVSLGQATARVQVSDDARTDPLARRLATALNGLLDELELRVEAVKSAERAARERYRLMFEGNPQPMVVYDPKTLRVVDANEAAARQYGWARDELLQMTLEDMWPAEEVAHNRELIMRGPPGSRSVVARHRRRDGAIRDVELRSHSFEFEGRATRLVLVTDVTERVRAEAARRAAEARFARLSDSGILGIIVAGLDGRVFEVNEALCDMLGYTRADILDGAVRWPELTPAEWHLGDQRARQELSSRGVASLREKEYLRKDGTRVPVLVGSAMLGGDSEECIAFVLDLRGSGRMEATIARLRDALAAEATFRSFLEAAPDAVVVEDRDRNIVLVNSQAERMFGYSRDELFGQPVTVLVPDLGRDRQMAPESRETVGPRVQDIGVGRELRGVRKDSSEFPLEISSGPVPTGAGLLVSNAIRDVSERKRAEEQRFRLAAIVDSSDDGIIGKTLEGVITSWNDGARRLFGYEAHEVVGRSIAMLIPDDRADEEPRILKSLAAGNVARFDTVRLRKDGTPVHVSVTSSPIRDSSGRLTGASKVVRDITERQRAEDALAAARDAAELANRELEAFSYSVAHDLRAPLRGMSGFAQIVLDDYGDKLDPSGREWLQEIVVNARKMGALIDALLSLSRVTRSAVRRESVDLSLIVRDAGRQLTAANPERSVDLIVQPDLTAELDPVLARALIDNLLGNAWKFTSKLDVARVEFGVLEQDGTRTFFVRDNGAGFDMSYASKLFGPFQRLHTVDEFPGTGIGLATVQRIVRRHGGTIWAEGAVDHGATFYFTLDRANGATS